MIKSPLGFRVLVFVVIAQSNSLTTFPASLLAQLLVRRLVADMASKAKRQPVPASDLQHLQDRLERYDKEHAGLPWELGEYRSLLKTQGVRASALVGPSILCKQEFLIVLRLAQMSKSLTCF